MSNPDDLNEWNKSTEISPHKDALLNIKEALKLQKITQDIVLLLIGSVWEKKSEEVRKFIQGEISLNPSINPFFLKPIDVLNFTVHLQNCLNKNKIYYVGDLVQYSEEDLLIMPHFGKMSMKQIKETLALYELTLDMDYIALAQSQVEYRKQ